MYYLSEFCLLCLNSKQFKSAFKLEDDEFSVKEQLKYCLPEIMISKSVIPNFICTSCRTTVNLFYKFRKTCLENYSRLTQYTEILQASSDPRCHKFSELQIQINKLDLTMGLEEDLESKLNNKKEIANSLEEHGQRTVEEDGVDTEEMADLLESLEEHDRRTVVDDDIDIKEESFQNSEDLEFYLKHLKNEPAPDNEQESVSRSSPEDYNQPDVDEANFSADADSVNATCTKIGPGKNHKCPICNKAFVRMRHFTRHLKAHSIIRDYQCSVCDKKFAQKGNLTRHMKTHAGVRNHKCSICDKMFVHKWKLKAHMQIHEEKNENFKCSVCDKKFTRKHNLIQHMKIHAAIRDHKCSICDKMFVQRSNLNKHMKIHEKNRNFKCSVCNKEFVKESSLVPHMKIHEGGLELDYECSVCNRKFAEEVQLERHMKLHVNNVGFDCAICNKKILAKRYFVAHMNKHAGIRKYKCSVCDKAYFGEDALASHMRKHNEN